MLPEWLDAERLQWLILATIALLLYGMYVVARFVQKLVLRFVLFVVLAGLGLSLWLQRADLQECADTCSCTLYGQEVTIPDDRRPDRCGPAPG